MKKLILGLLLVYSVNVLEASSSQQVAISYNPADFSVTIHGKSFPGSGLSNMVSTVLFNSRCSDDSGRSYEVSSSEDPRAIEAIANEMNLSNSIYSDPSTRLTPNIVESTHLVKGNLIVEQGKVTVNLRIEDRQGCLRAQAKVSGPEKSFYELIEDATRSLAHQMCMPKSNVLSECEKGFYTATLNKKTTKKAKVLKSYCGMSKSLKNMLEDHEKFYIYVDVVNGKVIQHFVEDESYRKMHREKYELNMQTCQYSIDVKDTKIKKHGARPLLRSDDMGWGIEDETEFYVKLPHTEKRVSFTWKYLKKYGRINKNISYSYGVFDLPKDLANNAELKKGVEMAEEETKKLGKNSADYIRKAENNEGLKKFQKFVTHPLTPKDIQCGMDVSMESMMMQPLDGTLDPKVNVKVNIRNSTKAEIAIMKASMKKGE